MGWNYLTKPRAKETPLWRPSACVLSIQEKREAWIAQRKKKAKCRLLNDDCKAEDNINLNCDLYFS